MAVLVVLVSSVACSEDFAGPIKSFTAEREKITKGQSTKLTAVFDTGVGTIDHDIGEVQSGQAVDTPMLDANTTYTLTDTDDSGNANTKSVEVKVVDPAKIVSFKADKVVRPGESTTVTAVFEGGNGVVDNGIGEIKSGVPFPTGVLQ
ncbi:MAG TPA: hypothetical protein VLT33_39245, partial [Labilithrix sp.]|nr:hypothetical protein [Labilithrix sp.]